MKRILIGSVCIVALAGTVYAQKDPVAFFLKLRAATMSKLPDTFSGLLTGKTISQKMTTIPQNSIINKGVKPYVQITYSKVSGVTIKVKNVDELYEDLYAQYVKFFTLGPVLTKESDQAILQKYTFSFSPMKGKTISMLIGLKSAKNYYEVLIDTDAMQIQKVDYYIDKEIVSSTVLSYTKSGKNSIPTTFMVKTFNGAKSTVDVFNILLNLK